MCIHIIALCLEADAPIISYETIFLMLWWKLPMQFTSLQFCYHVSSHDRSLQWGHHTQCIPTPPLDPHTVGTAIPYCTSTTAETTYTGALRTVQVYNKDPSPNRRLPRESCFPLDDKNQKPRSLVPSEWGYPHAHVITFSYLKQRLLHQEHSFHSPYAMSV